jgi:hypothetical protein
MTGFHTAWTQTCRWQPPWDRFNWGEAVLKRAGAKNAQNYFLYSSSPIAVISTFSFQIREIEKKFLRAI